MMGCSGDMPLVMLDRTQLGVVIETRNAQDRNGNLREVLSRGVIGPPIIILFRMANPFLEYGGLISHRLIESPKRYSLLHDSGKLVGPELVVVEQFFLGGFTRDER